MSICHFLNHYVTPLDFVPEEASPWNTHKQRLLPNLECGDKRAGLFVELQTRGVAYSACPNALWITDGANNEFWPRDDRLFE